jgi:hypothetical protein
METEEWCGLVVRTRARLRFGVVVGIFTEGPYAGRLRVHGPYRFGSRRGEERIPCILVYAIPRDAVRLTRRGVGRVARGGDGGACCLAGGRVAAT